MNFNATQPIYQQIIDDFRKRLIRGELQKGDRIPSQREYAEMARVNPNTVQRAYREMENMEIVQTLRGQGTYISISPERLAQIKQETAGGVLSYFIDEMKSLGYSGVDMVQLLQEKIKEDEI